MDILMNMWWYGQHTLLWVSDHLDWVFHHFVFFKENLLSWELFQDVVLQKPPSQPTKPHRANSTLELLYLTHIGFSLLIFMFMTNILTLWWKIIVAFRRFSLMNFNGLQQNNSYLVHEGKCQSVELLCYMWSNCLMHIGRWYTLSLFRRWRILIFHN